MRYFACCLLAAAVDVQSQNCESQPGVIYGMNRNLGRFSNVSSPDECCELCQAVP
jgi:hypothetical protein